MSQKFKNSERGQILLIVILVVIVSLTIGLSLASRGVTNIKTSTEEADSQKALAAAEAEIEKRLQNTAPGIFSGSSLPSTSFSTVVSEQTGIDTFLLNGGSLVSQGEGADVWLADHLSNGEIDYSIVPGSARDHLDFFNIYWGVDNEIDCDPLLGPRNWPAAIEVIVISGTSPTTISTKRYAYDLCTGRNNSFESAESNVTTFFTGGPTFRIRTPQGVSDGIRNIANGIFIRIIPVYKSTKIGVHACNHGLPGNGTCVSLPSQGFQISSTGTADTANRRINVFKGHQQLFLPYLAYGLFVP